jgi:CRP/FNR family cyclic AMP-dependent transcriptional regulator
MDLDIDFLASTEVCQGMTREELGKVLELCQPDRRSEGEVIHGEGTKAKDLFLLHQGEVHLRFQLPGRDTSDAMNISVIKPGGVFGWSALVPPRQYTLAAWCATPSCRFLRVDGRDLERLFDIEPHIGYMFMRNLAVIVGSRLRAMREELAKCQGFDMIHGW